MAILFELKLFNPLFFGELRFILCTKLNFTFGNLYFHILYIVNHETEHYSLHHLHHNKV